jgi:hypothetical protein
MEELNRLAAHAVQVEKEGGRCAQTHRKRNMESGLRAALQQLQQCCCRLY